MTKREPQQKAKDVTVSEGLAKVHEASEQLTEEEIEALAEDARQAASAAQNDPGHKP